MSEKNYVADSKNIESESDSDEAESISEPEKEDEASTYNKEILNTANEKSVSNGGPPSLVFEKDISNMLRQLESRTQTRIIDMEDRDTDVDGSTLHVPSPVLASQIKKIAPSVSFADATSSEAVKKPSDASIASKSSSSSNASRKKSVQFHPVVKKLSIIPEALTDDNSKLDDQSTEEVIDEVVKKIPVCMKKKRQRRDTLMILLKETPWYTKLFNNLRRFFAILYGFELWHEHLKTIEGRFGVAVVSYFLFIRWLLFMNIIILLLNLVFLVLPQFSLSHPVYNEDFLNETFNHSEYLNWSLDNLKDKDSIEMYHKNMYAVERFLQNDAKINGSSFNNSSPLMKIAMFCRKRYQTEYGKMKYSGFLAKIQSILDGRGWLESTLLFIGSYAKEGIYFFGCVYNVPLAFLWVFIISFIICLVMMIRYSSFGIEETFLTLNETTSFSNEIFSAWDFCIRTPKAAAIHHDSIMVSLKSELFEVRTKRELRERSFETWAKLYSIRVLVNIFVLLWIAACYILIYNVAVYQLNEQKKKKLQAAGFRTLLIQYLPPVTVTGIAIVSPIFFNFLISFEKYHAQTEVNISLIRNVFLSLSSVIVLVNTFHREVTCIPKDICGAGKGADCKTPICWETHVGQQLYKLNLSQLFVIVASFILFDVPREFFVKTFNNKISRLIGKATFFLPTEVLVAVYSQTTLWLGVFYSPLLPLVTCIKLIVLFYVKKTKVLQCSQKSKVHYKASRFNSTFINILLLSFFAVLAVHFYTLKNIRPSLAFTPFSHYNSMLLALKDAFQFLPFDIVFFFNLILSGWFFIPCSIILCTTIFYYRRYNDFLKNMEENLKTELTVLGQDKKFILQRIEALSKDNY